MTVEVERETQKVTRRGLFGFGRKIENVWVREGGPITSDLKKEQIFLVDVNLGPDQSESATVTTSDNVKIRHSHQNSGGNWQYEEANDRVLEREEINDPSIFIMGDSDNNFGTAISIKRRLHWRETKPQDPEF